MKYRKKSCSKIKKSLWAEFTGKGVAGIEIEQKNGGKQSKQMQTMSGKMEIERTVYGPEIQIKDEAGNIHFTMKGEPMALKDEYLNKEKLPFKMTERMMSETADCGQGTSSYEAAAEKMKGKCGFDISGELVRQVTDYVGGLFFEKEKKEAEKLDKNLLNTPFTHNKPGILYIMTDGAMINTRVRGENGSSLGCSLIATIYENAEGKARLLGKIITIF